MYTEVFNLYSESNLITLQDYYRNNKDLSIIIGSIIYVLNIVDAYVDAHLFTYNISDDLSLYIDEDCGGLTLSQKNGMGEKWTIRVGTTPQTSKTGETSFLLECITGTCMQLIR